jgi:sugar O-acyltransferase (sialic acid O-acetyltransferase NeuD family)
MDDWVIFGFGNFLSDIFDNIHSNNGRIKEIVGNLRYNEVQLSDLKRRLSQLNYDIFFIDLESFHPRIDEKYFYGFREGRDKLMNKLKQSYNLEFSNLIHPTSYLGSNIHCGEGIYIGPHSTLAPNCKLDDYCIINRASSIGHDTTVGKCTSIMPGVAIGGLVTIGNNTFVGIGATIIDRINIGRDSFIGAGSVVIRDVPNNVTVVGVPARILRECPSR